MNKINLIVFVLLLALVVVGVTIYRQYQPQADPAVETVQPAAPEEPIKRQVVHYPVPETPPQDNATQDPTQTQLPEVLPPVQESDQSIGQALEGLFAGQKLSQLLFLENFIQRAVATIDNLPEKRLPRAHFPIKPPAGNFIVSGTPEAPQISSLNSERYLPYLELLESTDPELTVKIYTHFYPLFQKAYEQLGYKNAYFNDRLVFVIDHLLDTPNPADPLQLEQPGVLFTYTDHQLENRSAGQKILLRIGQEQRIMVFKVLSAYKAKLTNMKP